MRISTCEAFQGGDTWVPVLKARVDEASIQTRHVQHIGAELRHSAWCHWSALPLSAARERSEGAPLGPLA